MFKLGLIINPLAGIGGATGLKGSDGADIVAKALSSGAKPQAANRALTTLKALESLDIQIYCCSGPMGEQTVSQTTLPFTLIENIDKEQTTAQDTIVAAKRMKSLGLDLILFVGGDGTARDIYEAVSDSIPVLGLPAGVKMHSGVYAVSPLAAADVLQHLIKGKLVDIKLRDVKDIDEESFREGRVKTRFYGELSVPTVGNFVQHVKSGGREVEALVLEDIAAHLIESFDDETLYLIGTGSTPKAITDQLGLEGTLLGVDAIKANQLIATDLNEQQLLDLIDQHSGRVTIIVTLIGGQGHVFGRGNQQFSPTVIEKVGIENILIVATKTKITELNGRPLLVDTGCTALDEKLVGLKKVITGYHDEILYPMGL